METTKKLNPIAIRSKVELLFDNTLGIKGIVTMQLAPLYQVNTITGGYIFTLIESCEEKIDTGNVDGNKIFAIKRHEKSRISPIDGGEMPKEKINFLAEKTTIDMSDKSNYVENTFKVLEASLLNQIQYECSLATGKNFNSKPEDWEIIDWVAEAKAIADAKAKEEAIAKAKADKEAEEEAKKQADANAKSDADAKAYNEAKQKSQNAENAENSNK